MAFVTLEQYKTYAGITSSESDRKLEGLLTRCEELVKNYCGIRFDSASYTEEVDVDGYYIFLNQLPATAITSVEYYDFEGTLTALASTEYRLYQDEGMLELTLEALGLISESKYKSKQVKVVYTGGYTTIPQDIKQVTMDIVKYYDKSEYTPVASANIRTIDYDVFNSISFPPHIRRVLAFYRKID